MPPCQKKQIFQNIEENQTVQDAVCCVSICNGLYRAICSCICSLSKTCWEPESSSPQTHQGIDLVTYLTRMDQFILDVKKPVSENPMQRQEIISYEVAGRMSLEVRFPTWWVC